MARSCSRSFQNSSSCTCYCRLQRRDLRCHRAVDVCEGCLAGNYEGGGESARECEVDSNEGRPNGEGRVYLHAHKETVSGAIDVRALTLTFVGRRRTCHASSTTECFFHSIRSHVKKLGTEPDARITTSQFFRSSYIRGVEKAC